MVGAAGYLGILPQGYAVTAQRAGNPGQWDGRHREPCMGVVGALGAMGPMESDGGQGKGPKTKVISGLRV